MEAALLFYGRIFDLRLRATADDAAFIDLGDQFLVFRKSRCGFSQKAATSVWWWTIGNPRLHWRILLVAIVLMDPFPSFLDPWGNRVEIVDYARVAFLKAPVFRNACS